MTAVADSNGVALGERFPTNPWFHSSANCKRTTITMITKCGWWKWGCAARTSGPTLAILSYVTIASCYISVTASS